MTELISYRREVFTFMERLILQEAVKRQDLETWMRITMQVMARDLGIPPVWVLPAGPRSRPHR